MHGEVGGSCRQPGVRDMTEDAVALGTFTQAAAPINTTAA
jgi:hypothetical protein